MNKGGLTGDEKLTGFEFDQGDASVLDFWRWAFSDLRFNDVRGVFAEWLVGKLLNIELTTRDSRSGWDLETLEGVKVEVKTGGYLQAWPQKRPSSIIFNGLKGQTWSSERGYSGTATYNADLYVFCIQIEKQHEQYNPLDLDQWRFHVLTKEEAAAANCRSISRSALLTRTEEMSAGEFAHRARALICTVVEARRKELAQPE